MTSEPDAIDAAAASIHLTIPDACRAGVVLNTALLAEFAALVGDFPLDACRIPAATLWP